ncbi:MAG: HIT family protein [Candidatus Thorarchaeota archaeon]
MIKEKCIFCQIAEKALPAKIIFESNQALAFLDICPVSDGHSIVIPKKHYLNLESIPLEELQYIIKIVKEIATLIHYKLQIDGYNILQNNFQAAGQVIDHFHFHIIPRRMNDSKFRLYIPREKAKDEDLNSIYKLLID